MNRIFIIRFILAAVAVLTGTSVRAQCKNDFGADKPATEVRLALYGDAYKSQKYQEARAPINWLLRNAPRVGKQIYVDGIDIYDKLAKAETDPAKKQILIDSIMIIFDLRLQNCGDEAQIINRKANMMFSYYQSKYEKLPEILAIFDKSFELYGNNLIESSLTYYMKTVQLLASKNKGNLSSDSLTNLVVDRFDRINGIIDAKTKKALEAGKNDDVTKLATIRNSVDDLFAKSPVNFTCALVKSKLEPKFRKNPTDTLLAKKIFTFMLKDKCTDDPLWLETGELIKDKKPKDFGLIKNLAIKHLSKNNVAKAESLMKEALSVATSNAQKSEAYLTLGSIAAKSDSPGSLKEAKNYFLKSTELGVSKEGFNKIGDLYFNSFSGCAKYEKEAEDKLIYIAAFDMYQRACGQCKYGTTDPVERAANVGMQSSKQRFPSKEEIFLLNWKQGDPKTVSCWFSEVVTVRTRD